MAEESAESLGMFDKALMIVARAQLAGAATLSDTFLGNGTTMVPGPRTM